MKRTLVAILIAAFAGAVFAQPAGTATGNPWASDHNFIAPAP